MLIKETVTKIAPSFPNGCPRHNSGNMGAEETGFSPMDQMPG